MSPAFVAVVIGLRGPSSDAGTRLSAGIPKRNASLDSTLSLPKRKASVDSFSCHNATREESPKQNTSVDKTKSGSSLNWSKQAKNASAVARAVLFDR
jgi:hypothetical protein